MVRNKRIKGSNKSDLPEKADTRELVLTKELIKAFLEYKDKEKFTSASVAAYKSTLQALYRWLPPDKILDDDIIEKWSTYLHSKYAKRTVNHKISILNSLLDYAGQFDMLHQSRQSMVAKREIATSEAEVLSRTEYLKLLRAAKSNENYSLYLVIKVIAITGMPLGVLPELTVDSVKEGMVQTHRGNYSFPHALQEELKRYIQIRGVQKGTVFTNAHGEPMARTTLIFQLKTLGEIAGIDPSKVSYGALIKMHDQTMQGIWEQLETQFTALYDDLLHEEDEKINWW